MLREADIRAYDPERDANIAEQPRCAKATTPQNSSRSRYAIVNNGTYTLTTLVNFNGANGQEPTNSALIGNTARRPLRHDILRRGERRWHRVRAERYRI
jgi:hypothetical protein